MKIHEVANIEEAVELGHELKEKGDYNWFRGQVQEWPPVSSLFRIQTIGDSENEVRVYRRIDMFSNWAKNIRELQYLLEPEHIHDFCAILQHYGIPTHYIDFTTDPGVAGFFAADSKSPPSEGKSCIYCLNTDELMSVWRCLKDLDERKGASIETVEIDVKNLWRLQAQRGAFVFANYNWQIDYPMDRIVFPYSGYPSYPTREGIYPEHKSPLEQLLDQYIFLERATFANEMAREMVEKINERGGQASYHIVEALPEGLYEEAFISRARWTPLESWSHKSLKTWDCASQEDYHQTAGPTIKLKLTPHATAEKVRKSVSFGVRQFLHSGPNIRLKTVNWSFTELPDSLSPDELDDMLRPVWNGMRRLPYGDDEIANACGSVAVLLMVGLQRALTQDEQVQRFSECFGMCIRVGFSNPDGSGSYALATRESLRRALRPDIAELLMPEFKERVNDIRDLFGIIYNPRLMFEFEEFKKMFGQEVIPAQVVLKRDLILFSPAQLQLFGNP
jgi:hypothetical protein